MTLSPSRPQRRITCCPNSTRLFRSVDVKSTGVTLTPVQTTPSFLTRSTVFRHTLSVTITYHPIRGEDGLITITSVAPGDVLLTQLGSEDFVSDLQEDKARISALILNAKAVSSPTPDPTPYSISCQQHLPLSIQRHFQLSNQRPFSRQYRKNADS